MREWEKKAKTPTEILGEEGEHLRIQISGGYKFIIPQTCDAMIGMPPFNTYHRYQNYEKMIEK